MKRRTTSVVLCFLLPGCLAGLTGGTFGCSQLKWQADEVQGELSAQTQFEIAWGSYVRIGFPGTVNVRTRGSAEGQGAETPDTEATVDP